MLHSLILQYYNKFQDIFSKNDHKETRTCFYNNKAKTNQTNFVLNVSYQKAIIAILCKNQP